ncbi:MAG: DegT/DnrJ/EryC1/StrS family aminotransferase [Myxococcota bacterium]|nr:DegT/DnrJ/EryC1/StrS family aminotransferase [Myxococcota bacterium]
MKIPLVDLSWQHREIEREVRSGFDRVMASSDFVLGTDVDEFEQEFAKFCDVPFCVGVANGTDAIELGLRALCIGPGDEVIVPANTFIASALAVVRSGAKPVFVDCESDFHLIDVKNAEAQIGDRTRAILAVDLFGQLPDMGALENLAKRHGLSLVEDAAQAHGATQGIRRAGAFGALSGTSFYPGKNLGAYGDAGAVTTRDPDLAHHLRKLRNYGSDVKYQHPVIGFNSRLDSLQSVVLRAKLTHLSSWNAARAEAAGRYAEMLAGTSGVALPKVAPGNEHVWHIYAIRVQARSRVLETLQRAGIGASVHYPIPIHLTQAFADGNHRRGDFPNAEAAAEEMISLPIFPGITASQQEQVAGVLKRAVEEASG